MRRDDSEAGGSHLEAKKTEPSGGAPEAAVDRRQSVPAEPNPFPGAGVSSRNVVTFLNTLGDLWRMLADGAAREATLPPRAPMNPETLEGVRVYVAHGVQQLQKELARDLHPDRMLVATRCFNALVGPLAFSRGGILTYLGNTLRYDGPEQEPWAQLVRIPTTYGPDSEPETAPMPMIVGREAAEQGKSTVGKILRTALKLTKDGAPILLDGTEVPYGQGKLPDRFVFDQTLRETMRGMRDTVCRQLDRATTEVPLCRAVRDIMEETCSDVARRLGEKTPLTGTRLAGAVLEDCDIQLAPLACEAPLLPLTLQAAAAREVGRILSAVGVDTLSRRLEDPKDVRRAYDPQGPVMRAFDAASGVILRAMHTYDGAYFSAGDGGRFGPLLPGGGGGLLSAMAPERKLLFVHKAPACRH